jgi:hypothetical protein
MCFVDQVPQPFWNQTGQYKERTVGEWSDYFEDFPEENAANWVDGKFDPKAAEAIRAREAKQNAEQAALDATIRKMIADGKTRAKAKNT